MKVYSIIFLFLAIFTISCSTNYIKGGKVTKRSTQYEVTLPKGEWRQGYFEDADLYFLNSQQNSTIYINSQCEKISDSPLEAMTSQMLVGFSHIKIINQEYISIAKRQALVSEIQASLDGVNRYLKVMVLRKNNCVYDAVLSMPRKNNKVIQDFDELIQSLWVRAKS